MTKSNFPNPLKAILFDMDGVLFDSMKTHAWAWIELGKQFGVSIDEEAPYLHEGRTGEDFIRLFFHPFLASAEQAEHPALIKTLYTAKCKWFNAAPKPPVMPGVQALLKQIKEGGIQATVVTGSGQKSLIEKIETHFPGAFRTEGMVTAEDVSHGKPHPEPYLTALRKLQVKSDEAVVIENAPLGILSAVAAGIYTIGVNTGPLDDRILLQAGADQLFSSLQELSEHWQECSAPNRLQSPSCFL